VPARRELLDPAGAADEDVLCEAGEEQRGDTSEFNSGSTRACGLDEARFGAVRIATVPTDEARTRRVQPGAS